LREVVERVRAIPYGRNDDRTPAGVLAEGRGTCSTKHMLLAELLSERPELDLRFVHRVYRIDVDGARALFGDRAAAAVPPEGLMDVHTYVTVVIDGRRTVLDVTFPSEVVWDGVSDMPLACGDGEDFAAGDDPWGLKNELILRHCDFDAREPFIAALSEVSAGRAPGN
jgi:hypothetical protein